MDQLPTLQQLEYLESGFEVSKILAQAGFPMDKPASPLLGDKLQKRSLIPWQITVFLQIGWKKTF